MAKQKYNQKQMYNEFLASSEINPHTWVKSEYSIDTVKNGHVSKMIKGWKDLKLKWLDHLNYEAKKELEALRLEKERENIQLAIKGENMLLELVYKEIELWKKGKKEVKTNNIKHLFDIVRITQGKSNKTDQNTQEMTLEDFFQKFEGKLSRPFPDNH